MALSFAASHRIYYVSTFNRTGGTNEYFTCQLQIPHDAGFDRVVVLQASIPNSFYIVQNGFNTFTLREDDIDTTITVPAGNYSARVFATVVGNLLTTNSPHMWTYTMALPNQSTEPSTGKFTYTVSGNDSQPSIICTVNVNEQLGFDINTTNTFVANSLVSTSVVNFASESTVFIHSDIADSGDSDVLQEIYSNNAITLSRITYLCQVPELYSKMLRTNKANIFTFSLTNEKGQLLNLNGVDMELTLCLYKRDSTPDKIRQYIHYRAASESGDGSS